MAKQNKAYFFTGEDSLQTGKHPSQVLFQTLIESIPFFNEETDTASVNSQGLVKLAPDASAISRTSIGGTAMKTVIQPHQLPETLASNGLKIVNAAPTTHNAYTVGLDFGNLPEQVDEVIGINIIVEIGGVAKRMAYGSNDSLWFLEGENLMPKVVGPISVGSYNVIAGGLYGDGTMDDLYISSFGYPNHKGTNMRLVGGDAENQEGYSTTHPGGDVYVHGGLGIHGGLMGNVLMAYDGAGVRGKVGIGGLADSIAMLWVHGAIKTDSIILNGTVGTGGIVTDASGALVIKDDGTIYSPTFLQLLDAIAGDSGIPINKLSAQTINGIAYFDGDGFLQSSAVTYSKLADMSSLITLMTGVTATHITKLKALP